MITPKKNLADILSEVYKQAETDWSSCIFSWPKAYLSSLISLATYHHIPEYEVRDANRLNIVPCSGYGSIVQAVQFIEASQVYQISNLEGSSFKFQFIEREMVVALVASTPKAIFIALRGTEKQFHYFLFPGITMLKDWVTNLQAGRIHYPNRRQDLFHKGFYQAVESIYDEVLQMVSVMPKLPIYITGHSLGGAMAAILYARWLDEISSAKAYDKFNYKNDLINPLVCYAFGMPRYGNTTTIKDLANPYHIYNEKDGVPTLPPRILGYSDAKMENEYCLSELSLKRIDDHDKGSGFIRRTDSKIKLLSVAAHLMESYIENMKKISAQIDPNGGEPIIEEDWIIIDGVKLKRRSLSEDNL